MIKTEVVFDGDRIIVGEYMIRIDLNAGALDVCLDGVRVTWFSYLYLEQAIKYCLEN